ncbi:pyrroline-5-carboxylate reductase [Senna tora]|uniref:Pyrroline-5-carboxylate reductase n=1 Tax=Senna tora TaxID=362788 RepID=A0A834TIZ1_9FABA|nr:pyrroline-5-carboxylate reductase [Senna tora]
MPTSPRQNSESSSSYKLLLRIMSKRRTWVSQSSSSSWPALYVSVLLGFVFGVLSMVAALAVVVPAVLVTWITIVVMLAFFGKPRRALVVEGRKITKEILSFVIKILLKEGNAVAAVCAVLGYFALLRRNTSSNSDNSEAVFVDKIG